MKTLEQAGNISAEDRTLLAEIRRVIQGFLPTASLFLYGSVARGAHDPDSDYDILVLTDTPLSEREENRIENAVYDVQRQHGLVIATTYYAKEEWEAPLRRATPFHQAVVQDSVRL